MDAVETEADTERKRPQNQKRWDTTRLNVNLPTELYDRFQDLAA